MKTATIFLVQDEKHFTGRAKLNRATYVDIDGKYRYTFTQLMLPAPGYTDATMVWKDYFTQDPMNWDGKTIGGSELSVQAWLESQGYTVTIDLGENNA